MIRNCENICCIGASYVGGPTIANGRDQNNDTIPEKPIFEEIGIRLIDGLIKKIQ